MKLLVERQLMNIIMIILTMTKSIICTHIHTPTISPPLPAFIKFQGTSDFCRLPFCLKGMNFQTS